MVSQAKIYQFGWYFVTEKILSEFICIPKKDFWSKHYEKFFIAGFLEKFAFKGTKQWKCKYPDCDLVYKRSGDLKRHVQIVHENQKNFKCQVCEKSFTRPETLKNHMAMHEGWIEFTFIRNYKNRLNRFVSVWVGGQKSASVQSNSDNQKFSVNLSELNNL